YSSPLTYSEAQLEAARTAVGRLWNNLGELRIHMRDGPADGDDAGDLAAEVRQRFTAAMDDDFNTRAAIEALFHLARTTNRMIGE
ncbi:DALR domain-containing protein, partial [Pseudomonas sp. Kh7]|uniref:DALR domain-containing protein n=1 Tax=Pseudomonas sp. Kh7 TaxID=2093743 RepID=UPI0035327666